VSYNVTRIGLLHQRHKQITEEACSEYKETNRQTDRQTDRGEQNDEATYRSRCVTADREIQRLLAAQVARHSSTSQSERLRRPLKSYHAWLTWQARQQLRWSAELTATAKASSQ